MYSPPSSRLDGAQQLDYSGMSSFKLPGGWAFTPSGTTVPSTFSGVVRSILDPAWGGNTGQGSNDSAAFVAALAWVNAAPYRALFIPPAPSGTYLYDETANGPLQLTASNAQIYGVGRASKIQFTGTTGDCVQMSGDFQQVSNLMLYTASATAGYMLNYTAGAHPKILDLLIWTTSHGIGLTNTVAQLYCEMRGFRVISNSTNKIALDIQTVTSNIIGSDFMLQGSNTGGSSTGIRMPQSVSQDTIMLTNFAVNGYYINWYFAPNAGGGGGDYFFSNFVVDQGYNRGIVFHPSSTGVENRLNFSNGWISAGVAAGAQCIAFEGDSSSGGGSGYSLCFSNCRIVGAGAALTSSCVQLNTVGAWKDIAFESCQIELAQYGVFLGQAGNTGFGNLRIRGGNISNCTVGVHVNGVLPATTRIEGVDCSYNNTTNFETAVAYNTLGPNLIMRNNPGINPSAVATTPAVPASGTPLTNPYPTDMMVYLTAATAGCVVSIDSSNNVTVAASAQQAFWVPAGGALLLTYTNAPSWVWVGN